MAIPATPGGALGFQAMLNKVRKNEPGNTERNMNNRKERLNEKFEEVQRDRGERQKRRAMERFERTGKKRGKGRGPKRGRRRPIRGGRGRGRRPIRGVRKPKSSSSFTKGDNTFKQYLEAEQKKGLGGEKVYAGGTPGFYDKDNVKGRRPVRGIGQGGPFGLVGGVMDKIVKPAIQKDRQNQIEKEFDKRPPKKGKGRPVKGGGKKGDIMRDKIKDKWDKTPPKKGKGGGIKRGGKRRDVGRRIKKARRNRRGKK
jgi:hypothetical protein